MITVHIQYFAILREQRGLGRESLVTAATTAAALYEELRARHGFSLPVDRVRAAINEEFVAWRHRSATVRRSCSSRRWRAAEDQTNSTARACCP